MERRKIIIGSVVVVLLIGWYLFRPELIFISKTVNEGFPGSMVTASIGKEPTVLTQGSFRGLGVCALENVHEPKQLGSTTGFLSLLCVAEALKQKL